MRHFVICNSLGEILRGGQLGDERIAIEWDKSDEVKYDLACPADPSQYLVENGNLREKTDAEKAADDLPYLLPNLRSRRDALLSQCDWTQAIDAPLSDAQKQAWRDYRQLLRDLPSTTDPANPVWPNRPT